MPYRIIIEYDSKTKRSTTLVSDRDFEQKVRREWFTKVWAIKGVSDSQRQLAEWKRAGVEVPKWHPLLQGVK